MTPDEFTNQEFFLDVGDGHQIYVQDWGNPKAKVSILFLHGGPGNGCDDGDKRKFDPKHERVIFHDQRGAGKSLPTAELTDNTTDHLVSDILKILQRLKVEKVLVVGGSWGSTLALVFAIRHSDRTAGLVIDGIFTSTKAEYNWLEGGGWRTFYPEIWEEYVKSVPASHDQDPSAYHFKQALSGDSQAVKKSVYEYLKMELALLKLDDTYRPKSYDEFEPGNGLIEIYFLANKCWLPADYILSNAHRIKVPVWIIQGRYDMVCPPQAAFELDRALPNSNLILTINGHLRQHEASTVQRLAIRQALGEA